MSIVISQAMLLVNPLVKPFSILRRLLGLYFHFYLLSDQTEKSVYEDKLKASVFKLIELRYYNDGCVSFSRVRVIFSELMVRE